MSPELEKLLVDTLTTYANSSLREHINSMVESYCDGSSNDAKDQVFKKVLSKVKGLV